MTDNEFFEDHEPEDGITGVREAVVEAAWNLADEMERAKQAGALHSFSITFPDPDSPSNEIHLAYRPALPFQNVRVSFAINTTTGEVSRPEEPEG